jgi:hypothetical protein
MIIIVRKDAPKISKNLLNHIYTLIKMESQTLRRISLITLRITGFAKVVVKMIKHYKSRHVLSAYSSTVGTAAMRTSIDVISVS